MATETRFSKKKWEILPSSKLLIFSGVNKIADFGVSKYINPEEKIFNAKLGAASPQMFKIISAIHAAATLAKASNTLMDPELILINTELAIKEATE